MKLGHLDLATEDAVDAQPKVSLVGLEDQRVTRSAYLPAPRTPHLDHGQLKTLRLSTARKQSKRTQEMTHC